MVIYYTKGLTSRAQARELLLAADRLSLLGQAGREPLGTLRVDMAETLLCYRMQPVIQQFRRLAPQVRLVIRSRNCLDIAENVRSGACDLGVGYDMDWSRDVLEVMSGYRPCCSTRGISCRSFPSPATFRLP